MSASIPPNGLPKATVTHECGDVRVTVRRDLTPGEAYCLCEEIQIAAQKAIEWRLEQCAVFHYPPIGEEAGK